MAGTIARITLRLPVGSFLGPARSERCANAAGLRPPKRCSTNSPNLSRPRQLKARDAADETVTSPPLTGVQIGAGTCVTGASS